MNYKKMFHESNFFFTIPYDSHIVIKIFTPNLVPSVFENLLLQRIRKLHKPWFQKVKDDDDFNTIIGIGTCLIFY